MSFKSVREKMDRLKLPEFSGLGKSFGKENMLRHELSRVEEALKLPDVSPKEQALSQSSVLCQMHLNGDLSFAELFNGLVQVKNKLERAEFSEIEADYKQSLKDSKE